MSNRYQLSRLREIMWAFYDLTGISITLFDAVGNRVLTCPEPACPFCVMMASVPETQAKCDKSNLMAFKACSVTDGPFLYQCHAGLTEAALALRQNGALVGYLMFGQVTDNSDAAQMERFLLSYCERFGFPTEEAKDCIKQVHHVSTGNVRSAIKIMEACVSYIFLNEMITPETVRPIDRAKQYIEENLSQNLDAQTLQKELKIGRTALYNLFHNETGQSIGQYIRKRRMEQAKLLLRTTEIPVWEIAQKCGFSEYAYFGNVFRHAAGKSPLKYRRQFQKKKPDAGESGEATEE